MFDFNVGDFKWSLLIKLAARLDSVVERELTVDGVVGTAPDFVAPFLGDRVRMLAFREGFVGVSRTAAVLDLLSWPVSFAPFAAPLLVGIDVELFFRGFDLPVRATDADRPVGLFLLVFAMMLRWFVLQVSSF